MRKGLIALVAAATLAGTLATSTTKADAQRWVAPLTLGILGGLIIGNHIARDRYYYGPPPVYVEPGPDCYLTRGRPVWNGQRWVRPTVEVCD
jgi:hypothetical protein